MTNENDAYEAPSMVVIGSLHELTLQLSIKQGPYMDGLKRTKARVSG